MTKLKIKDRSESDLGTVIHTTVEMQDENGVMVEYGIKDYYEDTIDNDNDTPLSNRLINTEIININTGVNVGEFSVLGNKILTALAKENEYYKYTENMSVSEKIDHLLANIGIHDEHFTDQIHTLIIHYTKHKKHQQDLHDKIRPNNDFEFPITDMPGFKGTREALENITINKDQ